MSGPRIPVQAPVTGLLLLVIGVPLIAAGLIIAFAGLAGASFGGGEAVVSALLIAFAGLAACGLGFGAVDLGRRLRAPSAFAVLNKDRRPPILYCRPFGTDNRFIEGESGEEAAITRLFGALGPVIAVGRPGDRLRASGAARVYLADPEWRNTVSGLMCAARLILIRAVATEHVLWEFRTAAERASPDRIVLIPPGDEARWREFHDAVDWLVVPRDLAGAALLCFDGQGTPRRLCTNRSVEHWWEDDNLIQRMRFLNSLAGGAH